MDLFLKISVLQANFCWLEDFEKIICPCKESVAGKKTIQGVREDDLMSPNAVLWHLSEIHTFFPPPSPTEGPNFAL